MRHIKYFYYSLIGLQILTFGIIQSTILYYLNLLAIIYITFRCYKTNGINSKQLILLNLIYSFITIFRGIINLNDYWDGKILLNRFVWLILPLLIFYPYKLQIIQKISRFALKIWWIPIVFSFFIFTTPIFHIFFFLVVLLPYLSRKNKIKICIIIIYSIATFMSSRGYVIRIIFAAAIAGLYYLNIYFHKTTIKIVKTFFFTFLIAPLLFLYLGISGSFNIFDINSYYSKNITTKESGESLTIDTRSFLYRHIYQSVSSKGNTLIGNSAIGSYIINEGNEQTGIKELDQKGRYGSESGLLDSFLCGGIIGALLYSMIFWLSSYYAIFRSRNFMLKLIGVFIIFRWATSFFDEPSSWWISNILLYVFMGICLSKAIREAEENKLRLWCSKF